MKAPRLLILNAQGDPKAAGQRRQQKAPKEGVSTGATNQPRCPELGHLFRTGFRRLLVHEYPSEEAGSLLVACRTRQFSGGRAEPVNSDKPGSWPPSAAAPARRASTACPANSSH